MKQAILKFQLNDNFSTYITGFKFIKILDIQLQNDIPTIWVICDIEAEDAGDCSYEIFKVGTGHGWSVEEWNEDNYIGTLQLNGYVWHYFWEENN